MRINPQTHFNQPRFNGGLIVKGFTNGEVNLNADVAKTIFEQHEADQKEYKDVLNDRRYSRQCDSMGESFVFDGDTFWLAWAIDKVKDKIHTLAVSKLGWDAEKTEKAIHKLYERLAGIDNLDFNEL